MSSIASAGMMIALNLSVLPEIGLGREMAWFVKPHLAVHEKLLLVISHIEETDAAKVGIVSATLEGFPEIVSPTFALTTERAILISGAQVVAEISLSLFSLHPTPDLLVFRRIDPAGVTASAQVFSLKLNRSSSAWQNIVHDFSGSGPNSHKLVAEMIELMVFIRLNLAWT